MNAVSKRIKIPALTAEEMAAPQVEAVTVSPLDMRRIEVRLIGTSPLMIARFSEKAKAEIRAKHEAGSTATKNKTRTARDFDRDYEGARHLSPEGWDGIHAGAFRNAMISACRLVGFKMTLAKLSLFVESDGYDKLDLTPLVRINSPKLPVKTEMMVRNATGVVDIRVRPIWREWNVNLKIRYDADQFTNVDVMNLLVRVGAQVGIGEGRPDSKSSAGIGFGLFRVEDDSDIKKSKK